MLCVGSFTGNVAADVLLGEVSADSVVTATTRPIDGVDCMCVILATFSLVHCSISISFLLHRTFVIFLGFFVKLFVLTFIYLFFLWLSFMFSMLIDLYTSLKLCLINYFFVLCYLRIIIFRLFNDISICLSICFIINSNPANRRLF